MYTIVMAHAGTEAAVHRHIKHWRSENGTLVFTSPIGFAPNLPNETVVEIGEREHHGLVSAKRIVDILTYALQSRWDILELNEYDSFCTDRSLTQPQPNGLTGIFYVQNKPHEFQGLYYIHYPHTYTRQAVEKLIPVLNAMIEEQAPYDVHYSDRFIGLGVQACNTMQHGAIPITDLRSKSLAYSRNTISFPKHKAALSLALARGAVSFHGVKTADIYEFITAPAHQRK